jgi:nucleotide-binding universal stress UspA family protein
MSFVVDKILCPVDFSEASREALDVAAGMARKLEASLTLLHVIQMPALAVPDGAFAFPVDAVESAIDKALAEWKKEVVAEGVHVVHTQRTIGVPFQEILSAAEEGGYGLIVIGTHGRTGLDHLLLGSVAERVVRRAPCPVLTVRPRAARERK